MKFTTAIIATGLSASTVLATPFAEPEAVKQTNRQQYKPYGWCVAPGRVCGKLKREAEAEAYAEPEPVKQTNRQQYKPYGWCVAPGRVCGKSKRSIEEEHPDAHFEISDVSDVYKNDPEGAEDKIKAGEAYGYCFGQGETCHKLKASLA